MSKSESAVVINAGGFFFPLLGLIFITLKLCGVINWAWLWVLAPLWGPLVAGVGLLVGLLMFLGLVLLGSYRK